jgi:Metallo-peptidase family M12
MSGRKNISQYSSVVSKLAVTLTLLLSAIAGSAADIDNAQRIHRVAAFTHLNATDVNQRIPLRVYGKQLNLKLENNSHLVDALPGHRATVLRGSVEGAAHSWLRLTLTATGTHGLIWDGADLYAVEPSAEVRDALAISLPAPTSDTVIFKLADTTTDLGANYCGATAPSAATANTGMATYQAITAELPSPGSTATNAPSLVLELQALGDAAFRAQYASDQEALDAIMVRLNNVDGIFTAQMGLEIQATDVHIYATNPPGLSDSSAADTLLSSLGQLRNSNLGMRSYAGTHLFTGRDLDGDTLGIAYIGNICGARYGTSLSEVRGRGAWLDSLVAAHELGHQLGAVHDGTGSCGGTSPSEYLMGAQINGSSELSQCSRDAIFATMQQAACLVPVELTIVVVANSPVTATEPATQSGGGGVFNPGWLWLGWLACLRRKSCAVGAGL